MTSLAGKRVVVTRAGPQAASLCEALKRHSAQPIVFPTIETRSAEDQAALDRAIGQLRTYTWLVFTSANGVRFFCERLGERRLPPGLRVAAVGPATARALKERGLPVDAAPRESRSERIAEVLGELQGRRVLLPRADIGREAVVVALQKRGAIVDDVVAYRTVPAAPDPEGIRELERGVDVVTFTSPSTVRNFVALLGDDARRLLAGCVVACIGPVTADAAREWGIPVQVQAEEYTVEGLLAALARHTVAGAPAKGD